MNNEIVEAELVEGTREELVPAAPPTTLFHSKDPIQVLERATSVATALAGVIEGKHLFALISGKKHITVEGWLTLAAMLGVTPVCVWTRRLDEPKGWEARVEARTLDGRVIGAAEAECLYAEKRWKDSDDYAVRSMAQTRATSKALGSVLRFVVTLAGYSGTPAEEMDGVRPHEPAATGGRRGPTDKQIDYLGRLLRERPDVTADDAVLMQEWARERLSGGREGSCWELSERLKNGGERADAAIKDLAEHVAEWQSQQTDTPADTEGLFPPEDLT